MSSSREQFGRTAEAYLTSPSHAGGPDLDALETAAALTGRERVVDLGTGAGHTARRLAPRSAMVAAFDPTMEMLVVARRATLERGLANVAFIEATAEAIPLPDRSQDVVATRLAAHHFPDLRRAMGEIARVLRPGGRVVFVDNHAPDDPAVGELLNEVERLRDPSHVRVPPISEWLAHFGAVGLEPRIGGTWSDAYRLDAWLARSQTPPDREAKVRALLRDASPNAVRDLAITPGSFAGRRVLILATTR